MIVLWVLLGLLLLIFLLLLVPAHLEIRYAETVRMEARYLFLRYTLLPEPEKPQQPEKPQKKEKQEAQKEEKKEPSLQEKFKRFFKVQGFSGVMHLAGDFLRLTGTAAVKLIRRCRLRRFDLYAVAGGDDAAAAAILYGQACAVLYPAAQVLFRLTKCGKGRISVDLDYNVKTPYAELSADLSLRPVFAVYYGLKYLIGLLPVYQRFSDPANRKLQKGEKNERKQGQ